MKPAQRPLIISPRYGTAAGLTKRVRTASQFGVDQVWVEQMPDQRDATVVAAAYLNAAPTVTVGTAVLPIYARHPVAMAQFAATLAEFSDGRFILGLGLGHRYVNEFVFGYQQGPPIAAMREYVSIVRTMLSAGVVDSEGRFFTARSQYGSPCQPVPIYLAALRPQMIRLAVELADGIVVWLCSMRYLSEQVMPAVHAACEEFGRDEKGFTVLTLLPAYTGDHLADQISAWRKTVASYRLLPYYRHVLDAHGGAAPEELALLGTEEETRGRLAEYRAIGCLPVPSPLPGTDEEFTQTVAASYGA